MSSKKTVRKKLVTNNKLEIKETIVQNTNAKKALTAPKRKQCARHKHLTRTQRRQCVEHYSNRQSTRNQRKKYAEP